MENHDGVFVFKKLYSAVVGSLITFRITSRISESDHFQNQEFEKLLKGLCVI